VLDTCKHPIDRVQFTGVHDLSRVYKNVADKWNEHVNIVITLSRVFASVCVKIHVYFSIKIYFVYFTYSLFKTPYIRLSILHYI